MPPLPLADHDVESASSTPRIGFTFAKSTGWSNVRRRTWSTPMASPLQRGRSSSIDTPSGAIVSRCAVSHGLPLQVRTIVFGSAERLAVWIAPSGTEAPSPGAADLALASVPD